MAKSVNRMQPRFGRLGRLGRYQAGDLLSQVATAELSGAGQMIITVSRELTVNITGREQSAIPATRASRSPSSASAS